MLEFDRKNIEKSIENSFHENNAINTNDEVHKSIEIHKKKT